MHSGQLGQSKQVVQTLRADKTRLEHQLGSSTSIATLAREARALGYVRPGERLFIVKGINALAEAAAGQHDGPPWTLTRADVAPSDRP